MDYCYEQCLHMIPDIGNLSYLLDGSIDKMEDFIGFDNDREIRSDTCSDEDTGSQKKLKE